MTTAELDAYVSECEQLARTEGWAGPWTLQVGDIQHLVDKLGRKLTADEGEYLRIPRWAGAHVERCAFVFWSATRDPCRILMTETQTASVDD